MPVDFRICTYYEINVGNKMTFTTLNLPVVKIQEKTTH